MRTVYFEIGFDKLVEYIRMYNLNILCYILFYPERYNYTTFKINHSSISKYVFFSYNNFIIVCRLVIVLLLLL